MTTNSHTAIGAVCRTKGKLGYITVVSVVNAAGVTFKYVVVYPGREVHHRVFNSVGQFPQTFLTPCKFYLRDPAGVDSSIFFDWLPGWIEELKSIRPSGQKVLLLMDGYSCHLQYPVLSMMKEDDIIAVGLPS